MVQRWVRLSFCIYPRSRDELTPRGSLDSHNVFSIRHPQERSNNVYPLIIASMTTIIPSTPQTSADSAPQLTQHGPTYAHHGLFNPSALPDPTHLQPTHAKRRIKADRRLLFELDRTRNASKRRSSQKAMGKRMFFLLSERHCMQKVVPLFYGTVLQLDRKASLVSQYRLPAFRDGFSHWVEDTSHLRPMQSQIALDSVSWWQEKAGRQLPSISMLLKRGLY